jgi:hypothetical protein
MGPNTRLEAIRDTQDDILSSLKRISRYTTDVNTFVSRNVLRRL